MAWLPFQKLRYENRSNYCNDTMSIQNKHCLLFRPKGDKNKMAFNQYFRDKIYSKTLRSVTKVGSKI